MILPTGLSIMCITNFINAKITEAIANLKSG